MSFELNATRVVTLREQWTLRFVRRSKRVLCGYPRREMVVKLTPNQIGFDDDDQR